MKVELLLPANTLPQSGIVGSGEALMCLVQFSSLVEIPL